MSLQDLLDMHGMGALGLDTPTSPWTAVSNKAISPWTVFTPSTNISPEYVPAGTSFVTADRSKYVSDAPQAPINITYATANNDSPDTSSFIYKANLAQAQAQAEAINELHKREYENALAQWEANAANGLYYAKPIPPTPVAIPTSYSGSVPTSILSSYSPTPALSSSYATTAAQSAQYAQQYAAAQQTQYGSDPSKTASPTNPYPKTGNPIIDAAYEAAWKSQQYVTSVVKQKEAQATVGAAGAQTTTGGNGGNYTKQSGGSGTYNNNGQQPPAGNNSGPSPANSTEGMLEMLKGKIDLDRFGITQFDLPVWGLVAIGIGAVALVQKQRGRW